MLITILNALRGSCPAEAGEGPATADPPLCMLG